MSSALSLYTAISNSASTVATVEGIDVTTDDDYVINLTDDITILTKYQDGLTYTMADGTANGQLKTVIIEEQNDVTISTSRGKTRLTAKQPTLEFIFYNSEWHLMSYYLNQFKWFPTTQQGSKLVGTSFTYQGADVAMSADGNTLAVSSLFHNSDAGGVVVFVRDGATWTQQGDILVGTGATEQSPGSGVAFGQSVALSADGNTLAVGAINDWVSPRYVGATWIFTRSDGIWTQQGNKIVGTGNTGSSNQGSAVTLSNNGNVLLVSGFSDDSSKGAVWIFTRSGSTWSQVGSKRVGTGIVGSSGASFGDSTAISDDDNTIVIGASGDNDDIGAVWTYVKNGSDWVQQGSKIVGTGYVGTPGMGGSISLSADGNVLAVGGRSDNSNRGAVWIFTKNNTTWVQQGSKLTNPLTYSANDNYGRKVCLSKDGNTLLIGVSGYSSNTGTVMVYLRQNNSWDYSHLLTPTDSVSATNYGYSIAMDSYGKTVAVSNEYDNSNAGATWVFV